MAGSARPAQRLEEVVVTAQRRAESVQRAAVAVSVLAADDLREAGVTRPQELTELVPALQVAATSAPISIFYLRGAGNFTGNALTDSAVAFNVGGVYIGASAFDGRIFLRSRADRDIEGSAGHALWP